MNSFPASATALQRVDRRGFGLRPLVGGVGAEWGWAQFASGYGFPRAGLPIRSYTAGMWPTSNKTEEMLADAKAGDGDAVNQLMERHRDGVRRMIQMRLDQRIQRRIDVSDVVQDVMVEAHRRLKEYLRTAPMPFHLWLRQIARDRIIDAHRRHRVSSKRSVDREQPLLNPVDDRSSEDLAAQLWDPEVTPGTAAIQREMARRVEEAVAKLNELDFEIITMRHYEQLSNQEVAQALGLTEPAASMRYLRAVRRLRDLLGGDAAGGPAP